MNKEIELLKKKIAIEEAARVEAEQILEKKLLELQHSTQKLKNLENNLENVAKDRIRNLQKTELEYQTMIESVNEMIFRLDLKGNIIFSNHIAGRILDTGNESLLGKNIFTFIAPENRKKIFFYFARQFLLRNCISYFDIPVSTKQKKIIWIRLNVQFTGDACRFCEKKQHSLSEKLKHLKAENNCSFTEIIVVGYDITQHKLDQEKLIKSEKKFRELTEALPQMICEINKDGIITYANKFAINKFGYRAEEVLDNKFNILKIFPKTQKEKIKQNFRLIYKKGITSSNEYLAQNKSGEEFSVIIYTSPIYEQNKIIGLRGVMFDITDRKKHEVEVARNLKQQAILSNISLKYNSLSDFEKKTNDAIRIIGKHLNISRVYIFEDSKDGNFTSNTFEWCNKNIESQKDELQNIPYSSIPSCKKIFKEDKIIFSKNISELPQDIINILEPKDIKSILILPLSEHGQQFGFIGFDECNIDRQWNKTEVELLRTISNIISNAFLRNKMQTNIINRELENRAIINSIPDVILQINSEGQIRSLKTEINYNLFKKLKNDDSDNIYTAFDEKLARSFAKGIKKGLKEDHYNFDFKFLSVDRVEYYETRIVKLNKREVMAIIRNVTEAKESEKELRIAKNKAENASRSKSEFLANVSHEIRTPLNAILGFSQWLYDNIDNEEHKGYLNTILTSGKNLLNLINDILNLSKIESGKMDIDMQPMQYQEIITDIKMVFQQKIKDSGMTFQVTTDKSVPAYIYMDELRFYQIIFNLVSNAVKFTSRGFIHVSAYATKTDKENEINLAISVEDTGIGIKEDQQKTIFESFKQQSGQNTRNFEGTGLGLAIVSGLLQKLNGTIQLKSKVGRGSTFTITFHNVKIDTAEHKIKKSSKEIEQQLHLSPCTIMVVDDVEYNRMILKQLVRSENVTFMEAAEGSEAIAKLREQTPDIIFMDVRMPGMSGYDVTEIIKEKESFKHIPVIAFTASTVKHKNDKIDQLFDGYLQKPVFKKELNKVLREFLPYEIVKNENQKQVKESNEKLVLENQDCPENLPDIIDDLEKIFVPEWNEIKDNLIIYEIENFKNQLDEFVFQKPCAIIADYTKELAMGLQSFDIEKIERQLNGFPDLIKKMKLYLNT